MDGADAKAIQGFSVLRGSVSLVPRKAIAWVALVHFYHDSVSRDLSHDGGGCDGEMLPIALGHAPLGN